MRIAHYFINLYTMIQCKILSDMNLKCFPLLISFLILLFSCSSSQEEENIKLKEKVIAIHDEVMPKIGELRTFQQGLLEKANRLENSSEADDSHIVIQELRSAAHACEEAYDNMFVWMRQFKSEYSDMDEQEVKVYLEDQLGKVGQVSEDILTSLHEADSLLSLY
jgi:membrane-associated HD superfamily phosphohydrolase